MFGPSDDHEVLLSDAVLDSTIVVHDQTWRDRGSLHLEDEPVGVGLRAVVAADFAVTRTGPAGQP